MYLSDVLTLPANMAGIPGISVPSGVVDGMPVGFQILAAPLHEETMPRVASAYEQGHRPQPDLQAVPQPLRPAELAPPEAGGRVMKTPAPPCYARTSRTCDESVCLQCMERLIPVPCQVGSPVILREWGMCVRL